MRLGDPARRADDAITQQREEMSVSNLDEEINAAGGPLVLMRSGLLWGEADGGSGR